MLKLLPLKSEGFPKKSHRSALSPVSLKPVTPSTIVVVDDPRLSALKGHDPVDLPAFQQLGKALDPWNIVSGGEREMVPDIEVGVAVLRSGIGAVLGNQPETIQGTVVEAMSERVPGDERYPVRQPLGQCYLQAVVVGTDIVRLFVDVTEIRKFREIRSAFKRGLLIEFS